MAMGDVCVGLEAGKGHPRAGGCEGLVLGLLCFLPLLPQGCPGCSGSHHTRSHNICAPPTHAPTPAWPWGATTPHLFGQAPWGQLCT